MPERTGWITGILAATVCVLFSGLGDVVIGLAALSVLAGGASARYRVRLARIGAAALWGSIVALAVLMLADRFDVRYVWLYSGAELPIFLKLSNLWGGDEGTTLLLAAFCASLVVRPSSAPLRFDVNAFLAGGFALTAATLAPFAATPSEWLERAAYQGMNAHLMKVWMFAHAPLVLAAYAWTLSLASPALAALAGDLARWPDDAVMRARRAWALLTAGIGFGMVWAFEDAMYGQVWHWDPVQTAVFAVWCLLGAHLHGLSGWRVGRPMWRWTPLAAALAAALTLVAMGVTRHDALASSHRYVGATSSSVYFSLAGLLVLTIGAMRVRGSGRAVVVASQLGLSTGALRATQIAFVMVGVFAAGHLAWAFVASAKALPRPDELRPFFSTLTNWARGSELPPLRSAFAQWDVDGYALARALLFPLIAIGLLGGWFFLRRVSARLGWVSLALAALACAGVGFEGGLLVREYSGKGVLSQQIVAVLPRIDASLAAGAYLALGTAVWSIRTARRTSAQAYVLSLGMVHLGAMMSLWGALLSTALNGYSQHVIDIAETWQREHQGYAFRVTSLAVDHSADGGRTNGDAGFRALAQVEVRTPSRQVLNGETLYRDGRRAIDGYAGPVRQICEILDYRYARYANEPGYVLDPFIDRGWARDIQLWVSPSAAVAALEGGPQVSQVVVVLRVFPFASLLWMGLLLTSAGALWLALRRAKEQS